MAKVSIYLNFQGNTKEAFEFYKSVFNTEFEAPITYNKDIPAQEGMPAFSNEDKEKIMHVSLPLMGGVNLMGTDMLESMGNHITMGNNVTINLEPDSKEETERLFNLLSKDGSNISPMQDQFWGSYWGCCDDRFGISWMFNYAAQN